MLLLYNTQLNPPPKMKRGVRVDPFSRGSVSGSVEVVPNLKPVLVFLFDRQGPASRPGNLLAGLGPTFLRRRGLTGV